MAKIEKYSFTSPPVFEGYPSNDKKPISNYGGKAAGISEVVSDINSAFDKLDGINDVLLSIKSQISNLDYTWGKSFIKLNGLPANIVHSDKLIEQANNILNLYDLSEETISTFLSDAETKINEINSWISLLNNNYKEYSEIRKRALNLANYINNNPNIDASAEKRELSYLNNEMMKYTIISNPTDHGTWVE